MATPNYSPFRSLTDPNSILGPNFLRVLRRRIFRRPLNQQNPAMMAGAAGVNPLIADDVPEFPSLGPLIRTSRFSGPPSERPDWRDPEEQWDAKPVTPRGPRTVGGPPSTEPPSFISSDDPAVKFAEYRALSPQSRDIVSGVQQPAPTGIAGGTMESIPEVATQYPQSLIQEPMAPVAAGIGGMTQRRGVRTAYGMVYPSVGQEAAAQQLARRRPREGRLANVREQSVVRPQMVASAISEIEAGRGAGSLEGLTQAEKVAAMRQRGRQLAKSTRLETEEYFNVARAKRDEEFRQKEEKRIFREAAINNPRGGQSRQRSWSNYTGDNPIANFADTYEDEETKALAKGKQRGRRTA
jgi:hypothetical protein